MFRLTQSFSLLASAYYHALPRAPALKVTYLYAGCLAKNKGILYNILINFSRAMQFELL